MFFTPPKVKSLSRYAEYGAYLGNIHFLMMLAIAFTVHIGFIVIYSMTPTQDVIRIPVRPLNIKLSGDSNDAALHMPAPAMMPGAAPQPAQSEAPTDDGMKSVGAENAESAMDEALKEPEAKPATPKKHPEPAATGRAIHLPPARHASHGHNPDSSISTPKRYVREAAKLGATATVHGDSGGKEAIERYTQVVSQWIKNHQTSALDQYKDALQGHVHGQAVIRLRIDRDGHILYNSVDRTSGNELVDEVAIATVRASDPVPAVPSDYPSDSQLEFLIAVQVDGKQ